MAYKKSSNIEKIVNKERRKVKIVKGLFNFKPCLLRLSHLGIFSQASIIRKPCIILTLYWKILGI